MRLPLRSWIWLMLLVPLAATAQEAQPSDAEAAAPDIPKFYSVSRQILLEVEAWETTRKKGEIPWIGDESLRPLEEDIVKHLTPVARGLEAKDFHVFDNGVEQSINYFKEADFPAFDNTNHWYMIPSADGTWGIYDDGPHYGPPSATYLIGYVPPRSLPGECRTLRVVAEGHDVQVNRDQYCAQNSSGFDDIDTLAGKKLGTRMRDFATSSARGSVDISMHASAFWSFGVLSVIRETLPSADTPAAGTDFNYVVEVHDSKAPAAVQITAGFRFREDWAYPCHKDAVVYILGMAYKTNGDMAGQFADTYSCLIAEKLVHEMPTALDYVYVPLRFDSQIPLPPGDYDLRVVVSDGKNFGRARMALHVERLDPQHLMISDVVIGGVVRYAGWVLREAAAVNPSPVVPSPLVSKDSQYFPDSDKEIHLHKRIPLYFYFEIYEPQLGTQKKGTYYRWRITNQKSGSVVLNSEPTSAADWVVPGNVVIPIGTKIDANKLPKGNYKLEVQASDSSGQESEWRAAEFRIK